MKDFLKGLGKKLSSRKVWMSIIAFVGAIVVFLNAANLGLERLVAVLTSFAVLVVYVIGECIADAKNKTTPSGEDDTINWKRKFASRKFWAALISFVTTLLVSLGVPEITVEQIAAMVVAISSVCVYILGESAVDGAPVDDLLTLEAEDVVDYLDDLGYKKEDLNESVNKVEEVEDQIEGKE